MQSPRAAHHATHGCQTGSINHPTQRTAVRQGPSTIPSLRHARQVQFSNATVPQRSDSLLGWALHTEFSNCPLDGALLAVAHGRKLRMADVVLTHCCLLFGCSALMLMFHPGKLHATMFVSCAQRIVARCFIVMIVACVASAQRHAHGRIRHARASPESIISGVFSVETAPSHRKTAQKRRRCLFRCTAHTARRRSMPAVYLLLYRAVIRALPPVMSSTSGRRFGRS